MSSTGVGANRKEWIIRGGNGSNKTLIDRLLEVRGISSEEAKKDFLNPLSITLMHPNAFCDMPKAVDRIVKAGIFCTTASKSH